MKAIYFQAAGAVALTFTIAACVPRSEPPSPTPPPVVRTTPTPTPAPPPVVQEPVYVNFLDAPQTPGDWSYRQAAGLDASFASFAAADGRPRFGFECYRTGGTSLSFYRMTSGPGPRTMTIRTETATRTFSANAQPQENSGGVLSITLNPADPLLDAMAITKGRFAVAAPGAPTLYLPAWTEVSRVIEDCR